MPVHLLMWSGAKTDSTADQIAPTVQDQIVSRNTAGNAYIMPWAGLILYGFALNDTIARAYYTLPSMRDLGNPEISYLNAVAEPSALFRTWAPGEFGPRFKKTEELSAFSSNGASTVDTIHIGALICDGIKPVPAGRRFMVQGTATQTLVANAWTSAQIALTQNLPYGTYAVIGMRVTCNDAIAGRLIFPNMQGYRPGVMSGETEALSDFAQHGRFGQWGELGRFDSTAPPMLECLGGTAGAETPVVYLDMVALTGSLAA